MEKSAILNKYSNDGDKLFISKILDKIKLAKTRNQIVNTDFLDMYQKKISTEILKIERAENYIFYKPWEETDRSLLIIYPEKFSDLFLNHNFNYGTIVKAIRIELPNELKGKYTHRDYLSGIMKLGIKREKIGDISVFDDGADIVVCNEICEYLINSLNQLTRFKKSKIEEIDLKQLRIPEIKKEIIRITVPTLRLDSIVSELAHCSRTSANDIILSQRVFINYENETKNSKQVNIGDVLVIRGKGKFIIKELEGKTRKDKLVVIVEHYI